MNHKIIALGILTLSLIQLPSLAKIQNTTKDNEKQFGKEIISKQFTDDKWKFNGKKVYKCPLFGWQIEALFKDGKSYSESARPKEKNAKKDLITEQEANVIADMLFEKKDRGDYRKQVKNAHFISHFFENGVISYEMKLDASGKNHIGVMGVRAILYSNGEKFKDIKINAYH